ncbi:hypothetical protein JRO89_XS06G0154600 [Xanthoceras sorbifolium]|uniref:Uncharacterized protein n=1 Tax=Xanthoceras sorbifolium TaxID=99658 RepID=A0ABQ8HYG5_9ROSI|nr:hypothetical protein JRO89_XS06G0154600 [Xanthoceras sorbifolium]
MSTRIPSHQLSSGLYVSGRPEQQLKERQPTMASRAVPYTGGDIKKSGELGKMFDIPVVDQSQPSSFPKPPSRPSTSSQPNSGSVRSGPNSGSIKKSSGPLPLQPTGLITSGPVGSGPLGARRSGQLDGSSSVTAVATSKMAYGSAVTKLGEEVKVGFRVSRARYPDAELRGAVDGQYVKVTGFTANKSWHITPSEIRQMECETYECVASSSWVNSQCKVVVTCGSIPLESSYQRIPRCVYVSTELYEYKGWGGKSANPKHRCFSWGSRHSEEPNVKKVIACSNKLVLTMYRNDIFHFRLVAAEWSLLLARATSEVIISCGILCVNLNKYVSDFYISDFQSGLRALVKAGYGTKVAPFVEPTTVVNVTKGNRDLSPNFLRWLADRNLSSDDRTMRLKEGYIKEGSTVSVMGVVQRHDNVLMIVPSTEPVSTGCQWTRCLLPTYVEVLFANGHHKYNRKVEAYGNTMPPDTQFIPFQVLNSMYGQGKKEGRIPRMSQ